MINDQKLVKDFMLAFKQDCPDKPTQLDEATAKLRAALILEEAFETITKGLGLEIEIAEIGYNSDTVIVNESNIKNELFVTFNKVKEVDLIELADGLADIHYVAYCGTAVSAGIDMEPIFNDVDESNKTKFWLEKDLDKAPEGFTSTSIGNGLFIVRGANGKVAKPPTYRAADPGKFIQEQVDAYQNQLELSYE